MLEPGKNEAQETIGKDPATPVRHQTLKLKHNWYPSWTWLDSYIFSEIHFPFAMAMLVYNGIFFIKTLGDVSEISGGKFEIPLPLLTIIFISKVPQILFITTALSFLFAALLAFGRMSADSEIIAPQSLGVSYWRLNRPVFSYALILSMLLFFLANWGAPRLNQLASNASREFFENQALPTIDPGVITPMGSKMVLYVDHVDAAGRGELADLAIISRSEGQEELMLAKNASIYTSRWIELYGYTHISLPLNDVTGPLIADMKDWRMRFPMPADFEQGKLKNESYDLYNSRTLWRVLKLTKNNRNREMTYEFFNRLFSPFTCLILALLVVPLSIHHTRTKSGSGFGLSLFLVAIYFALVRTGKDAVMEGRLSPLIGNLAPLVVFLILGFFLQAGKNFWWSRHLERSRNLVGMLGRGSWRLLIKLFRRRRSKRTGLDTLGSTITGVSTLGVASTFIFPSKLDKYTVRSFFSIYFLVQGSFILIFFLADYLHLSSSMRKNDIELDLVMRYFLYKTPGIVNESLFISLLVSILILFAVMSKNREITAIRAAGGGLHRLCLPLILLGFLLSGLVYYWESSFLPHTNRIAAGIRSKIRNSNAALFTRDVWLRTSQGEIVNYKFFDEKRNLLVGVNRYRFDPSGEVPLTILIDQRLAFEGGWISKNEGLGWQFRSQDDGILQPVRADYHIGDRYKLELNAEDLTQKKRKVDEFSIAELRDYLRYLRSLGYSETHYQTELYAKYAKPLMPLIMMLLAMPLGFQFGRRGTFYGLATGLVAGLSFLGLFELVKRLGATGIVNPITAGWAVIVLFGFIALYRFINME